MGLAFLVCWFGGFELFKKKQSHLHSPAAHTESAHMGSSDNRLVSGPGASLRTLGPHRADRWIWAATFPQKFSPQLRQTGSQRRLHLWVRACAGGPALSLADCQPTHAPLPWKQKAPSNACRNADECNHPLLSCDERENLPGCVVVCAEVSAAVSKPAGLFGSWVARLDGRWCPRLASPTSGCVNSGGERGAQPLRLTGLSSFQHWAGRKGKIASCGSGWLVVSPVRKNGRPRCPHPVLGHRAILQRNLRRLGFGRWSAVRH